MDRMRKSFHADLEKRYSKDKVREKDRYSKEKKTMVKTTVGASALAIGGLAMKSRPIALAGGLFAALGALNLAGGGKFQHKSNMDRLKLVKNRQKKNPYAFKTFRQTGPIK